MRGQVTKSPLRNPCVWEASKGFIKIQIMVQWDWDGASDKL